MSAAHPSNALSSSGQSTDNRQPSNAKLVLRLLGLTWRYRGGALKLITVQTFMMGMMLAGLGLTGLGIDVMRYHLDSDAEAPVYPFGLTPPASWSAMTTVVVISGAVLLVAIVRFFTQRADTVWRAQLVQNVVVDLRAQVYDKLQRLSFHFFDANESGSIINRVTGDVQGVRMFVDGVMVQVLAMVLSLTLFLFYMMQIHAWLTMWCLITTPLLWFITSWFSRLVKPAYRQNRELADVTIRVLSENVQGVHAVKGFGRQQQEVDKFHNANRILRDHKRWIFWRVSVFVPLIAFLPQVNLVILLVYGGYLHIVKQELAFGSGLIVFAGLLQQVSTQVANIANIANSVQVSLTGAQRVFEVLDTPLGIEDPATPVHMERAQGHVQFKNVSFEYKENEPALQNINFEVKPGQTVAILGATGAGKSTLLSLIPRFYDPTQGQVLIDGVDLKQYSLDSLRRNIGLVFQESFLFSNTVAQNIAFGHPEATTEQIEKAARIASAHGFITELPKGYNTLLSEGGNNLSGGQRQRLAIARAILLDPPILLLDDPTAAIDPETEHEILMAMSRAMANRTTFVVAHRLSTLRRADIVIVMDKGRIVQAGTHDELMSARGHYRYAANLQMADQESKRLLGISLEENV